MRNKGAWRRAFLPAACLLLIPLLVGSGLGAGGREGSWALALRTLSSGVSALAREAESLGAESAGLLDWAGGLRLNDDPESPEEPAGWALSRELEALKQDWLAAGLDPGRLTGLESALEALRREEEEREAALSALLWRLERLDRRLNQFGGKTADLAGRLPALAERAEILP